MDCAVSYDVQVYRREVARRDPRFLEPEKLPLFTAIERRTLTAFLEGRGYGVAPNDPAKARYEHHTFGITATLTDRALYLSSSFERESVYTVCELASELAMDAQFCAYNPQDNTWEAPTSVARAEQALHAVDAYQGRVASRNRHATLAFVAWLAAGSIGGYLALGGLRGIVAGLVVGFLGRVAQVKLARARAAKRRKE